MHMDDNPSLWNELIFCFDILFFCSALEHFALFFCLRFPTFFGMTITEDI
jgi:hypothetical protein